MSKFGSWDFIRSIVENLSNVPKIRKVVLFTNIKYFFGQLYPNDPTYLTKHGFNGSYLKPQLTHFTQDTNQ